MRAKAAAQRLGIMRRGATPKQTIQVQPVRMSLMRKFINVWMREYGSCHVTIYWKAKIVQHFDGFVEIRQDGVSEMFLSNSAKNKPVHISRVLRAR
jgi:hypothetical protein